MNHFLVDDLFPQILLSSYNVNNLRLVNKSAYIICNTNDFWENMFQRYQCKINKTIMWPCDFIQSVKKLYKTLNQINYDYSLLSIKIEPHHQDTLLKKYVAYKCIDRYELLSIRIKNSEYHFRFMGQNMNISDNEFKQLIFDCIQDGRVISIITYFKI